MKGDRFERIAKKPLRHLVRASKRAEENPPYDTRRLSKPEGERRLAPIVGAIAAGTIPLDETGAEAVAYVLDRHQSRLDKLKG